MNRPNRHDDRDWSVLFQRGLGCLLSVLFGTGLVASLIGGYDPAALIFGTLFLLAVVLTFSER